MQTARLPPTPKGYGGKVGGLAFIVVNVWPVKGQAAFTRSNRARLPQIANAVTELELVVVLDDDETVRGQYRGCVDLPQNRRMDVRAIGRVQHDEMKSLASLGKLMKRRTRFALENFRLIRNSQSVDIAGNGVCGGPSPLDECSVGSTPGYGFESERAGSGVKIKDSSSGYLGSDNVEERLFESATRGAGPFPSWGLDVPPP
jgi:hypothetical protein